MRVKRVIFNELPSILVRGKVRDYEPVEISTQGMTVGGLYIEVETEDDGEEVSCEDYLAAFSVLLEKLQDVVIDQVDKIIHKRLNPPSGL